MRGDKIYDVVIVGAGPGGNCAAAELAVRGLDVLVVERKSWPRSKLCGGGLTPKAYRLLGPEVGGLVHTMASTLYLSAGGVGSCRLESDNVAIWMVNREELDVWLLARARSYGAAFIDGESVRRVTVEKGEVRLEGERHAYRARIAIGADGVDSVVARGIGLRRRREAECCLAVQTEVRPRRDFLGSAAIIDLGIPRGYAWVFPKGEHYSVGLGSCDRRVFKDLPHYLDRFLAESGLAGSSMRPFRGHKIPRGGLKERLNDERVLLVGDAAGLADPLFGEGISYALKSGQIAASVTFDFLAGNIGSLDIYTEAVHRTLLQDLRALRATARFVHSFPGIFVRLLNASPRLQAIIADIISGDRSFTGVWSEPPILSPSEGGLV